jgi:hypothetical protein
MLVCVVCGLAMLLVRSGAIALVMGAMGLVVVVRTLRSGVIGSERKVVVRNNLRTRVRSWDDVTGFETNVRTLKVGAAVVSVIMRERDGNSIRIDCTTLSSREPDDEAHRRVLAWCDELEQVRRRAAA